jgi:hypothetical protein
MRGWDREFPRVSRKILSETIQDATVKSLTDLGDKIVLESRPLAPTHPIQRWRCYQCILQAEKLGIAMSVKIENAADADDDDNEEE